MSNGASLAMNKFHRQIYGINRYIHFLFYFVFVENYFCYSRQSQFVANKNITEM